MTALIAVLLLLFIPAIMAVVRQLRNRSSYLWLLAFSGATISLPLIYFSRLNMPLSIAPLTWQPETFFPISPALLIDATSWVFAMALATQVLSIMMTSVARLGGSAIFHPVNPSRVPNPEEQQFSSQADTLAGQFTQSNNWRAWAGNLALTGLGLVAVLAGNLLTLVLAWASLDIIELLILLGQVTTGQQRGRVIVAFSARLGGIAVMFMAGIFILQQGGALDFASITPQGSLLLMLASGLRLGVLPLHLPFVHELPMRRGIGTILRQVPVAASLILLVRTSQIPIQPLAIPYLLGLIALAGVFGAIGWLRSADEIAGRPYWILATTSLAMAAAIQGQSQACLAWSLATLLTGSLLFTTSLRRRGLAPIMVLGLLGLTALPLTPTWTGTAIINPLTALPGSFLHDAISLIEIVLFLIVHAILIAGYLIHGSRGILYSNSDPGTSVDRWIWILYPPGLLMLPAVHWLLGWYLRSSNGLPWSLPAINLWSWAEGIIALGLAAGIWYLRPRLVRREITAGLSQAVMQWLPVNLFYRLIDVPYRLLSRFTHLISYILEGEAGILWALVLMVLALVFLQ
jgi:hypothetical protein